MTQTYYGTKKIEAWLTAKEFPQTADEPACTREVYIVRSLDTPDQYVSWSPKDVFEAAYQPLTALSFGHALVALKDGKRVARAGWNGKGMWLAYSPGSTALPAEKFWAPQNKKHAEENGPTDVLPCLTMKTATGEILMGWLASQTDMLADDWQVIPD